MLQRGMQTRAQHTRLSMPMAYRLQVLSLAHDHPRSGTHWVRKTHSTVLKHFFWPGLKADIHCCTCHLCQIAGQLNQMIPRAPLCPIPVMGQPFFEKVIVNCGHCHRPIRSHPTPKNNGFSCHQVFGKDLYSVWPAKSCLIGLRHQFQIQCV